ncbi:hypothetical protein BV97_01117 [Novosphingobium resinovorum]|uniref:Uncharacterized protein n=1 Tax=Novosphingobium resinovorum TaxID=158500 RepID=A0A031K3Z2_9SPHN|nr:MULTISPECIES: hypothetical protein [Novosphingobium]EZP83924.1 hypothetical protein BV97_01117 [Novosphingobium resinovorum]
MKGPAFLYFIVAATLAISAATAREPASFELGGYIVGVYARPGDVSIVRGKATIPVLKPTPIAIGDRIVIANTARVTLQTNQSRQRREISARDSPFLVTGPPPPTSRFATFIDALLGRKPERRQILNEPPVKQNHADSKGVTNCPTSASGVLPLERARAINQIDQDVWGTQPFFLAWSYGQAPFSVKLRDGSPDGRLLIDRICENGIAVPVPEFFSGTATVEVSDATGKIISWRLRRVVEPQLPTLLPPGFDPVTAELARGLDALDQPGEHTRVMSLTHFHNIERLNVIAWRLLFAARDGNEL